MNAPSLLRRRGPARSAGVCASAAAVLLGTALATTWLGSASAQQQPASGQVPTGPPMGPGGAPAPDAQAKEKEEPPTPAELLIDEAKSKIAKLQSAAADIAETIDMLNQHITLTGQYFKAPQNRIYFRLTLGKLADDSSGTLLQVCDGETLWDYQAIVDSQVYHKFSVKPVMERLNSPDLDPKIRAQFIEGMGFSGPETLLTGLRRLFRFDQKEEGKLGDRAVWILRGEWKDRKSLTGPDQRQVALTGMLPPYVPKRVNLYLGKDDGWPYRLELIGQAQTAVMDTRKTGPDGRPIGSLRSIETVAPTQIVLEYSKVRLDPKIDVEQFAFQPGGSAQVEDGTEMIVKQLDSIIAMQAERKKAEATKKDGPVLDQSLDIPPPPVTPAPEPNAKP